MTDAVPWVTRWRARSSVTMEQFYGMPDSVGYTCSTCGTPLPWRTPRSTEQGPLCCKASDSVLRICQPIPEPWATGPLMSQVPYPRPLRVIAHLLRNGLPRRQGGVFAQRQLLQCLSREHVMVFVLGLILIILVEILHFDLSPSNVCEALKNNNQNLISSRQSVQTF